MAIIFLVQSAHTVPGLHPYMAASTFGPLISLDGFKEKCHVLCDYNTECICKYWFIIILLEQLLQYAILL